MVIMGRLIRIETVSLNFRFFEHFLYNNIADMEYFEFSRNTKKCFADRRLCNF